MPEYLVQYGRSAFVGRFASPSGAVAVRGDRVLVRTPRGLECGEVLASGESIYTSQLDPAAGGELLERLGEDVEVDVNFEDELLAVATEFASDMPLSVVDVEILFNRSAAILHVLAWDHCDADALCERLTTQFHLPVRVLDLSRIPATVDPPPVKTTCEKPGCGTSGGGCSSCGTGGGCGTKSCSSGSVKSAEELTSYFADLRQKMEAQVTSRTALN